MSALAWLSLGVPGAAVIWWLATACLAWLQPRGRSRHADRRVEAPGISVLVPVSSPAPGLASCVESLRCLEHDRIEILLLAAADDGPAIEAIEREAGPSPSAVRALVLTPHASPNPKVGLLAATLDVARHELILFTDDNTISTPARIRGHLERYGDGARLVSAAAVGLRPEGFWGSVDAALMNGYFARLQLAGDRIGLSGVSGKSMLIARSDIARSGGLLPTGGALCEDAALQKRMAGIGARTALSRHPVFQTVGQRTLGEVWWRHRRWFYCRRTQVPWLFASEAAVCGVVAAAFGALGAPALGLPWWLGASVPAALLLGIEWAFLALQGWPTGAWYPAVWIAREALVLPLWIMALRGGAVRWRGRRLRLGADPR